MHAAMKTGVCAPSLCIRLAALVLAMPLAGCADAVVTLCNTADQAGSGTNLQTALTATPDPNSLINTITFQCGGPATIQVFAPLEIFQPTKIDGGNAVTLVGNNTKNVIVVANPGNFLYLYNLVLRHPAATGLFCINWEKFGCDGRVVSGQGVTELHHVQIDSTNNPIAVSSGILTIDDCVFTGNKTVVVVASPNMTMTSITRSVFQNNPDTTIEAAGNVTIADTQFVNNGHAELGPRGSATIERTLFDNNRGGFGGALTLNSDTTIAHSTFSNNTTGGFGGAMWIFPGAGTVTLRRDEFVNNTARLGGGAVFWVPASIPLRQLNLLYSNFTGNKASAGGAVYMQSSGGGGKSVISAGVASFSHNTASGTGGAIDAEASELRIARGIFADNRAGGNGGAIYIRNAAALHSTLANSLFVRNTAAVGSAFYGDDADFINATVDGNKGLALANAAPHQPVRVRFTNSIISNNAQGGCGSGESFSDGGHNLQFPGTDCGASIKVANPRLDTLYIPIPESPPRGNGNLSVCMSPPISGRDVYGMGRPSGGVCTIGAAEGDLWLLANRRKRPAPPGCQCGAGRKRQ